MLSEEMRVENHKICLELLDKFIEVCDNNDITYYLSEGSALGVMRHHGFIPWDINIDVVLTVDQFEKLDKVMKNTDLGNDIIWDTPIKWGRICPILRKTNSEAYETKPNIDIAIYGRASNNKFIRTIGMNIAFFNIKMFKLKNTEVKRKFPYNILKVVTKIFPNSFYYGVLNWLKRINQKKDSEYMMALTPSFFGEMELIETTWFGNKESYGDFEGRKVRIFEYCHDYLTHRYGDYMTPVVWEDKGDYTGCFYDRGNNS